MDINLERFTQLRELLEKVGVYRQRVWVTAENSIFSINNGEVRFTFTKYAKSLYVVKNDGSKYRVVEWYDLIEFVALYDVVGVDERTTRSQEAIDLIDTYFPIGGGEYVEIKLNR